MIKGSGHPPINKICFYCHKPFQVKYKFRDAKCCSVRCSSLYGWLFNRKAKKRICKICHKEFFEIPSRIKNGRGIYCSRYCYTQAMKDGFYPHPPMSEQSKEKLRQKRIGKLNPAYIHGNNDNHIRYMAGFTPMLRKKIRTRDSFKCQKCGSTEFLVVHHIDQNPIHNEHNNLITWCRSCHTSYHKNFR